MAERYQTSLSTGVSRENKRPAARAEAANSPTADGLPETEPTGKLLTETNPGDVHFGPGSQFKLGEFPVILVHCLSLDRVVVSDPTSGEMRVATRTDLTPMGSATAESVQRPISLEGVSEEILARATARQEALRPYIASGVLSSREAHQLAGQLKTSTRTQIGIIQKRFLAAVGFEPIDQHDDVSQSQPDSEAKRDGGD